MKFVNLTPHEIKIFRNENDDNPIVIPPSGKVARVSVEHTIIGITKNDFPIYSVEYGDVQGIPSILEKDTGYIVSTMVLEAIREKNNFYAPGMLRRDSKGNVIGCIGLVTK